MSAEEALKYGLIDEIVQPDSEKLRVLALPPPGQSQRLFSEIPNDAEDYEFGKLVYSLFMCIQIYMYIYSNLFVFV